jgi:hypothetical protein
LNREGAKDAKDLFVLKAKTENEKLSLNREGAKDAKDLFVLKAKTENEKLI